MESVSQGIFWSKRTKVSGKKKDTEIALKYFHGFGHPCSSAESRSKFYRHLLMTKKKQILKLQQTWNEDFVTNVLKYIKTSEQLVVSVNQEAITPIAFLATGFPRDENKILLDQISSRVHDLTPHVANLSSSTCGNVKSAFQILCKQLMEEETCDNTILDDSELTDNEEELNATKQVSQTGRKKLKFVSANDLQNWYSGSPQKPVLIFIEDIDFFPLAVAQNLLMAFSCLKLPVMFVIGVTSCCENFDFYVPQRCPRTFLYKTFHPVHPNDRLTSFVNEIILDPNSSLQFSGPVVSFIEKNFLHHGFSCTRLEQIVQLCLLEHFRTPESVLCSDEAHLRNEFFNPHSNTQDIIKETYGVKCKTIPKMKIKKEPNGQHAITPTTRSSPRKMVRQTVQEPTNIIDELESCIIEFHRKKLEWYSYLTFLNAIVQNVPGSPFTGYKIADLYVLCWNGGLFQPPNGMNHEDSESPFDIIVSIFKNLSGAMLESQLVSGVAELEKFHASYNCKDTDSVELLNQLKIFVHELQTVEEKEKKLKEEDKPKVPKRKRGQSQLDFQATLKEFIDSEMVEKSVFRPLRGKIVQWINTETKKFLTPLHKLPHSKAFIFDTVELIREAFTPNPQKRIHLALAEPSRFLRLKDQKLVNGDEQEYEDKSDVSVLYNLLLEQEIQNINLNIIFESFKSMVEINPSPCKRRSMAGKPKKENSAARDQTYLIRFRQAVAELQHMGFLKRVKGKVDEVSRQTFGF